MCFLLTDSGRFSLSAAFSWSNWEQYLELIVWFSTRRRKGERGRKLIQRNNGEELPKPGEKSEHPNSLNS